MVFLFILEANHIWFLVMKKYRYKLFERETNKMVDITFGQFVRVLVDMNVTQILRYKVLVERKGYFFFLWNLIMRKKK